MKIMAWVAIQSRILKVKDYVLMQCIKGSSTLRVSPKGEKPSPRIVYRYGKKEKQIRKFIENRQFIKDAIRKLKLAKKSF